jgi:hypothetical protein
MGRSYDLSGPARLEQLSRRLKISGLEDRSGAEYEIYEGENRFRRWLYD